MNLSQIKDRVLRTLNGQFIDSFQLVDLINDGLSNLVDAGKLKASTTVSVIAGTNQYALPTNFKAPGTLQDETVVDAILPYQLVDISENRYGYAIESGFMYIKPMPTQNITLNHYYYKYATPLVNDTDIPSDIDDQYHSLLALYAIAMIVPTLKHDTSTRYAISAQNMYETRQWQIWQDGLQGFVRANARKNRNSRVTEKVVW